MRERWSIPTRIDDLRSPRRWRAPAIASRVLGSEESLDEAFHFYPTRWAPCSTRSQTIFDRLLIDLARRLDDCGRHLVANADQLVLITDMSHRDFATPCG